MKSKTVLVWFILTISFTHLVIGNPILPTASRANYVVIGAFAVEKNADEFVENAKKANFKAVSEINVTRNLFYVYILQTGNRKAAFDLANKIRTTTPFSDTWVYTGILGRESDGEDFHPETEKNRETITAVDNSDKVVSAIESVPEVTSQALPVAAVVTEDKLPVKVDEPVAGSKNFLFKIVRDDDQQELQGDIDVIDLDKTKKATSYKGNQNVAVAPVNKSGSLSFLCEVFGYRKMQKDINFNQPQESEGVEMSGDQAVVKFELTRLKKGDISVMYNVYFYKDAGIMRPESRYEVNSLVDMMKDNPKYKIKIHGHTNGSAAGKVVSLGDSKDYFSLNNTKEGFGSAKKLSQERSEVIRDFMVSEGIDAKRMQIKAWGGKRPIHDKMSAHAQSNVRVEIEILEDK
jgi:outer membrane protein OmpA-like peptidoglycan-associated protein